MMSLPVLLSTTAVAECASTSVVLVTLGSLEGAEEYALISLTILMTFGSDGSFTGCN